MYSARKIQISSTDPLYDYCCQLSHQVNNLSNTALFRCRQILTASKKEPSVWTDNERAAMDEIATVFPGKKLKSLSYGALERLLRDTGNPDFFAGGLPRQAAQQTLKQVSRDMNSFFAAIKAYQKSPQSFTGKPKLPHYKKKGGLATVTLTNQDCVVYRNEDGSCYCKFPLTKLCCDIGSEVPGKLKQVEIKPFHNVFFLVFIFEDSLEPLHVSEAPNRICAIDFGVENTAAITNNAGLPSLLFKGGVIKSQNQWYNKKMAKLVSAQTTGTTNKFQPTVESDRLCVRRENQVVDYIRKTSKAIILWCIENDIDTIVLGHNKGWKDSSNLGHKNNQEFVQFPIGRLQNYITLSATAVGIRIVEQEESYTSKASFADNDPIPTYGQDDDNAVFSGKRVRRGLYRNADGSKVNADLNGSANILRKAFPNAFSDGVMPSFTNVVVIKHPDYQSRSANREHQLADRKGISQAKLNRQARKDK